MDSKLDDFIMRSKRGSHKLPFSVKFPGVNGYKGEAEAAIAAGLVVGQSYNDCAIEIYDCHSLISIPGQPGSYNSVLFE